MLDREEEQQLQELEPVLTAVRRATCQKNAKIRGKLEAITGFVSIVVKMDTCREIVRNLEKVEAVEEEVEAEVVLAPALTAAKKGICLEIALR